MRLFNVSDLKERCDVVHVRSEEYHSGFVDTKKKSLKKLIKLDM